MLHPSPRIAAILSILQSLTLAAGFMGTIFAAGAYVQAIRDDIRAAEMRRAADDKSQTALLAEIFQQERVTAAASEQRAIAAQTVRDAIARRLAGESTGP